MKFSMILAVLPVALAAPGSLKTREVADIAARLAAGDFACAENVSLKTKKKRENSHTHTHTQQAIFARELC
jgi:hypothetical protein